MTTSVTNTDQVVRDSLVFALRFGDAHQTFDDAVADFPMDSINVRPPNVRYTFWHLIEHVRFCQNDMLEYLLGPEYEPVTFPDDYWPSASAMASEQQWHDTVGAYRHDLDRVEAFVRDEGLNLCTASTYVWESAHTPLRTVLVMADHAAYHGGELGILRQVMGLWMPDRIDHFTAHASVTQNAPPDTQP